MIQNTKKSYPSKTTLNLFRKGDKKALRVKAVAIVVIIVISAAAFAKFAVIDMIDSVDLAQNKALEAKTKLADTLKITSVYPEVLAEYRRYFADVAAEGETEHLVSRVIALELVEKNLMPFAKVNDFSISQNILTANLTVNSLADVVAVLKGLENHQNVQKCDYNYSMGKVFITITMVSAEEKTPEKISPEEKSNVES
ncbi:MAG: hypothetical protein RR057_05555 [Clostridia bacterium]